MNYLIIPPKGASFTGETVKSIFELMAESTNKCVHFEDGTAWPVRFLQSCSIRQIVEKPVFECAIYLG